MRIITISREFGSGGRELGKRLSEALGVPCYDQQIVELVAQRENLDSRYVANLSERELKVAYPATIARGFHRPNYSMMQSAQIMAAEHDIIRKLASEGDCVFIGRAADIILADMHPFRIFVCADEASRMARCRARSSADEHLTDRDMRRKCRAIDRRRHAYRALFTDHGWGEACAYDLCINTSGRQIKSLVDGLVAYISHWYSEV